MRAGAADFIEMLFDDEVNWLQFATQWGNAQAAGDPERATEGVGPDRVLSRRERQVMEGQT